MRLEALQLVDKTLRCIAVNGWFIDDISMYNGVGTGMIREARDHVVGRDIRINFEIRYADR